ncbi:hypothetical protein [Shewanella sp. YIC-542]|uniref:hypothetical protein n=1 Tax=Shewanella mytili TaxID=3377111 RepID=UPI00398ECFF3
MGWYLSIMIIAGVLLLAVPTRLTSATTTNSIDLPGLASLKLHKAWLLLPVITLCWLAGHLFTSTFSFFSLAAIGFVITPLTLMIPAWRPWMLASALVSMLSVLFGTLLG